VHLQTSTPSYEQTQSGPVQREVQVCPWQALRSSHVGGARLDPIPADAVPLQIMPVGRAGIASQPAGAGRWGALGGVGLAGVAGLIGLEGEVHALAAVISAKQSDLPDIASQVNGPSRRHSSSAPSVLAHFESSCSKACTHSFVHSCREPTIGPAHVNSAIWVQNFSQRG
jgi:hypothetical protein